MEKINAEVFLSVAETGSFRSTADKLGYTQAGISYIVNSMEKETGLSLFIREHNGVRLSREGEELLPYMKQLQVWERQFKQIVGELNGLKKGTLRVQIFDSISIHWIPGIVKRFHDDFPGVKIELISEEDSARAEQMVVSGEVDCGFFLTTVKSDIDYYPLIEENLLAIVAPDHPIAKCEKFPIKKLGDFPYISMKYDDHTGIGAIFEKRNVKPDTAFCMDNDYAAMGMVGKGLGYCIFPELLLTDMPEDLKCMEFDEPQKRTISIGTASFDTCSKACLKFIEYTKEWVKEYINKK